MVCGDNVKSISDGKAALISLAVRKVEYSSLFNPEHIVRNLVSKC